jgi:hypothetical protein
MARARWNQHRAVTTVVPVALGVICALSATLAVAGDAKGTLTYKARTANLKYAYLVKGSDAVSKQPIRRLILSATDLGAKISACRTLSCTDSDLNDGLSVNFDIGSRLNYWMVMNDQKIQYSGTQKPEALKTTADDAAAGGPKVDVEFDAALVKELAAS